MLSPYEVHEHIAGYVAKKEDEGWPIPDVFGVPDSAEFPLWDGIPQGEYCQNRDGIWELQGVD